MSQIRSSKTKPEIQLLSGLRKRGYLFHPKGYFGNPDFVNKNKKIVLFVDGCFWHGCPSHYVKPKSNIGYWRPKIEHNVLHDHEVTLAYTYSGWKVIRVWEHDTSRLKTNIIKSKNIYN